MTSRIGGQRRKTRHSFKKARRMAGKINLRGFFQNFKEGEKVTLHADSSYQKGQYFGRRFHSKVGIVQGMQGKCYRVKVKEHDLEKTLIIHPVHLRKA